MLRILTLRKKVVIAGVLIALLALGAAAWALRRDNYDYSRPSNSNATSLKPTKTTDSKPEGDAATPSAKAVRAAYEAYISNHNSLPMQSPDTGLDGIRSYLSEALYTKLRDDYVANDASNDLVACAGTAPASVVVGSDLKNPSRVMVTESFGDKTVKLDVTVDANYKIRDISCRSDY